MYDSSNKYDLFPHMEYCYKCKKVSRVRIGSNTCPVCEEVGYLTLTNIEQKIENTSVEHLKNKRTYYEEIIEYIDKLIKLKGE